MNYSDHLRVTEYRRDVVFIYSRTPFIRDTLLNTKDHESDFKMALSHFTCDRSKNIIRPFFLKVSTLVSFDSYISGLRLCFEIDPFLLSVNYTLASVRPQLKLSYDW